MNDVIRKFEQFLDEADCNIINSDDEFNNKPFRDICERHHITLNTIVAADEHINGNSNKLGTIDRFTRTIKNMLQRKLIDSNSNNWG